jgi:hypothetical protein
MADSVLNRDAHSVKWTADSMMHRMVAAAKTPSVKNFVEKVGAP